MALVLYLFKLGGAPNVGVFQRQADPETCHSLFFRIIGLVLSQSNMNYNMKIDIKTQLSGSLQTKKNRSVTFVCPFMVMHEKKGCKVTSQ